MLINITKDPKTINMYVFSYGNGDKLGTDPMRHESICHFCLKSGILCPNCQAKLKSGEVSEVDLKVARILLSIEDKYPALQEVHYYKAVEANGMLALLVGRGNINNLLKYGAKIIKELGKKMKKTIRVLEHGVSNRKFLEDLFFPLSIVTINTIWIPDGTTETRVILKRRGRRLQRIKINMLKEIAKKIRGMTLRVEFTD